MLLVLAMLPLSVLAPSGTPLAPAGASAAPTAAVGHWPFDEASGNQALDASGGGVSGTLSNASRVAGRVGSGAVALTGTDTSFVSFPAIVGAFGTQDFTVAFWLKTQESALGSFDVVGNRTAGSHGNFVQLRMTGTHAIGNGRISADIDQDGAGTNFASVISGPGYNDGQWHHVAVTRLGTALTLYVDGAPAGSSASAAVTNIGNGNPFKIGRSLDSSVYAGTFTPNASFDDLAVYDRALVASEVHDVYAPAPPAVPAAPTGAIATPGIAQATVTWTAPASNDGSPVTGYTVTSVQDPARTVTVGNVLSATVTGLTGGTSYSFTVRAINATGTGAPSAASNAVTPVGSLLGSNLIANGDAEGGPGAADSNTVVALLGWTTGGALTAVRYGATAGYPTASDPGPTSRGANFFAGGNAASSIGTQVVDLSAAAASLDTGLVSFVLSGYLGGFGDQNDTAALTAIFKDAAGAPLGTARTIGPVAAPDRGNATGLLPRTATGPVPSGTRQVQVQLTMTRVGGASNDGYADNLSLVFATAPAAPTGASATAGDGQAMVSWTAPASDGGSPVTGYSVVAVQDPTRTVTVGNVLAATVAGLTNRTDYSFTVRAMNAAGTGPASTASNTVKPVGPLLGSNLIVNGGAESAAGAADSNTVVALPGWSTSGLLTAVRYGATAGYPTAADAGPAQRGANFLTGGNAVSSAGTQVIDLSDIVASVDAGTVAFTLSGYLGGFGNQNDVAALSATFKSESGATLATTTIGPVTAADRSNVTSLLFRTGRGAVPSGTRQVQVHLAMTRAGGLSNDGYADELSLVLTPATLPGAPIGATANAVNGGEAAVTWTAPASDGGSPITRYTVTMLEGGAGPIVLPCPCPTTLSTIVGGLPDLPSYSFAVTATNAVGTGPSSAPATLLSNNADLSALTVSAGTLSFLPGTLSYDVGTVPDSVAAVSVTATAGSGAVLTVNGVATNSGAPAPVKLTVGVNTISVVVTAANGITAKTYTISIYQVVVPRLVITGISPVSPVPSATFTVTVQSRAGAGAGAAANVGQATGISLAVQSGTGTLGGTTVATIPAGQSTASFGVTYSTAESGVVLRASVTSGDDVVAGSSSAFDVFYRNFTVSHTVDWRDVNIGDGICSTPISTCSLRAAIQEANAVGAATITVPAGTYTLEYPGGPEDNAFFNDLDVRSSITLVGAGPASTIIQASGGEGYPCFSNDRIFDFFSGSSSITGVTLRNSAPCHPDVRGGGAVFVGEGAHVVLSAVTVRNTASASHGGAINNAGTLTVLDSLITDTYTRYGVGGGISNIGTLTVTNTTISDTRANATVGNGGGIYSETALTLRRSTINNSSAYGKGGGVYTGGSQLNVIEDSKITGNEADEGAGIYANASLSILRTHITSNGGALNGGSGGGIYSRYVTVIANSNISHNSADRGAGIFVGPGGTATVRSSTIAFNAVPGNGGAGVRRSSPGGGPLTLMNSIVSDNNGSNCGVYDSLPVSSVGYNISDDGSCSSFTSAGDMQNTDPLIGMLAENGGPALTHLPRPGSPAINAGSPNGCRDWGGALLPTDQRGAGFVRSQDGRCDIGSIEVAPLPPPLLASLNQTTATATSTAVTIVLTGADFANGSVVRWAGVDLPTEFVSKTQLRAIVPAAKMAIAGVVPVTVFTGIPGGGGSQPRTFTVSNPVPVLAALGPTSARQGTSGLALTVTGSGFIAGQSGSRVSWQGAALATTFVSATELRAQVPSALLTSAGAAMVAVVNPGPGGGASQASQFAIQAPTHLLTALSPASIAAGSGAFTVRVSGTNLPSTGRVRLNHTDLSTTWDSSSGQLLATVPAGWTDFAAADIPATLTLTVARADGSSGFSNALPLTITSPVVVNAASAIAGPGETVAASSAPAVSGSAGVAATLTNGGAAASDGATVTSATYSERPPGAGGFDTGSATSYVDLKVTGATSGAVLVSHFYYPSTLTGANEAALVLRYFKADGTAATVLGSGGAAPVKSTTDNLDGTSSGGRFTVTFDATSTPRVTDLTGTVMAIAADGTPPVVTPQVSGALGAGGWYTGDVAVAWHVGDGESVVSADTGCEPVTMTDDSAGTDFTCTATSAGGTSVRTTAVKRDATPPLVDAVLSVGGQPYSPFEWTNQDGTITFTCQDSGSGLATVCPAAQTVATEGEQTVGSGQVCDLAGNCTAASTMVRIDKTGPVVTVPLAMNVTTDGDAANPTYVANATDAKSGVSQQSVTCAPASGSSFALGTTTVVCTAMDRAGNGSSASFPVTVSFSSGPTLVGLPADITTEASNGAGAVVTYPLPAGSGGEAAACAPASGSTFPVGATTVICQASNALGTGSASFTVLVQDSTPPTIGALPIDLALEATGPQGAVATYPLSATDAVSGTVAVTCTPTSGASLPLGDNTVTCIAADAAGNSAVATFAVAVRDTTAPTLAGLPNNPVFEATGPGGAVASWAAAPTASDLVNGAVPVNCDRASGASFSLGVTTVTCTAADRSANTATGSFSITVRDTTPPSLTTPPDLSTEAASAAGAAVGFSTTATDAVTPSSTIVCSAVSGSIFPIGPTTVTCTAADAFGNSRSASFTITVIDTTAPELVHQFDPASKTVQLFGRDGGSGVSPGPLSPTSTTLARWGKDEDDADDDEDDDRGKKDRSDNAELRTYRAADAAGNTLTLVEKVKLAKNQVKVKVVSLQYDGGPVLAQPANVARWKWSGDKELSQRISLGTGKDRLVTTTRYDHKKNETTIQVKDPKPERKETAPGMLLLKLATDEGGLVIER
jgi:hypothetical protein